MRVLGRVNDLSTSKLCRRQRSFCTQNTTPFFVIFSFAESLPITATATQPHFLPVISAASPIAFIAELPSVTLPPPSPQEPVLFPAPGLPATGLAVRQLPAPGAGGAGPLRARLRGPLRLRPGRARVADGAGRRPGHRGRHHSRDRGQVRGGNAELR